jgi:hypothetical protein
MVVTHFEMRFAAGPFVCVLGSMDKATRFNLLRERFGALSRYVAPVVTAPKALGLVRATKPLGPWPRRGITHKVESRKRPDSLGIAMVTTWVKWLETQRPAKNSFRRLEPSRKRRVSPLILIAEHFPKRVQRKQSRI